jgi:hypothetical protein
MWPQAPRMDALMSQPMMTENSSRMEHIAVGRYELAGVNGAQLPTAIDPQEHEGEALSCSIVAGELRLETDGTYAMELTAICESRLGARSTRALSSRGTWRFLRSALDPSSGEIVLISASGRTTSAALAGTALVHRFPVPAEAAPRTPCHWVYIRRTDTP